jgi:hypothetical protein
MRRSSFAGSYCMCCRVALFPSVITDSWLIRTGSKIFLSADNFLAQEMILIPIRYQREIGCNTMKGLRGNRLFFALFAVRGACFLSNVSILLMKIENSLRWRTLLDYGGFILGNFLSSNLGRYGELCLMQDDFLIYISIINGYVLHMNRTHPHFRFDPTIFEQNQSAPNRPFLYQSA